ncbi:uncharacterized protein PV07_00133 [Cladophialophora immunda]|uniref:Uncharacterized protein n=1 Tax=Cladophialophora immunda TaxID=569365 RepID=A0A0D1ZYR5_9EURO|nr:uncharacterized protein PV07_00133 [Cladophialophora immunda]KIW33266.1 hypothetical protein PV07_00133 [Cladophialophora immunda]
MRRLKSCRRSGFLQDNLFIRYLGVDNEGADGAFMCFLVTRLCNKYSELCTSGEENATQLIDLCAVAVVACGRRHQASFGLYRPRCSFSSAYYRASTSPGRRQ